MIWCYDLGFGVVDNDLSLKSIYDFFNVKKLCTKVIYPLRYIDKYIDNN